MITTTERTIVTSDLHYILHCCSVCCSQDSGPAYGPIAAQLRGMGVNIWALGLGQLLNTNALASITGSMSRVYLQNNYTQIVPAIVSSMTNAVCSGMDNQPDYSSKNCKLHDTNWVTVELH